MWRLTLAQMRTSAGRLAAAGLAIMLGTAFVAVTLLATATLEQTTYNAVTAQLADADLVVTDRSWSLDADTLEAVRGTDGVAAADPTTSFGVEVGAGGRTEWLSVGAVASDPRLSPAVYTAGSAPTEAGQMSLGVGVADRLDVQAGDDLEVSWESWAADAGSTDGGESVRHTETVRITGLIEENSGLAYGSPTAYVTAPDFDRWQATNGDAFVATWSSILIALDSGADAESVRSAVAAVLPGGSSAEVLTATEYAQRQTAEITGNDVTFVVLPLGFAAVALAVAALVIANTFQVLVAQRTRSLALLRCVGATKDQVRSTVLIEAVVVGLVSSIAGLALGTLLMAVGLLILSELNLDVPLDRTLHLNAVSVLVPIGVGTIVTVLAALVPARMATRVAPLAALRPVEGEPERGAGRVRMAFAVVLLVGGAALLGLAVAVAGGLGGLAPDSALLVGLGVGVLGGLAAVLGLLIGMVFVVPVLIRLAGRILSRWVPGRIATANAVRNPRRTAATASALFIGVALVTLMSTGAAAAKVSLGDALATQFPVDVRVSVGEDVALERAQIEAVTGTDGVAQSALLSAAVLGVEVDGGQVWVETQAVEPGDLTPVLRDPAVAAGLADGTIVMPQQYAEWYDLASGDDVHLTTEDGATLDLTAVVTELGGLEPIVTPATFTALGLPLVENAMAVRLADDADEIGAVRDIQAALTDLSATADAPTPEVSGAAVERAAYTSVVDTLLAVVLGMLGVSVVIALVGVANTLSLSVLERRRESALLRAMGLTRGQLRGMLAVEGVLIAGAGAALGIVAGLAFGWAGTAVLLSSVGEVTLAVPWRDIALVVLVAVVAGLLASVLPARTAVRTPPVAALAMD